MKPKDLKAAFSWEERRPLFVDRVFHVPNFYDNHRAFTLPSWDHPDLFGNTNPVCIEYCTGNGAWIVERAKAFPEKNWVAVEIRYDRVRKIWSKIQNEKLKNLIVVSGEAWTFTRHYVRDHSIDEVFINFPDPWPKEKHEKHRLMKPRFLDELARILRGGGGVTFVSDDPPYLMQTTDLFEAHSNFNSFNILTDFPDYGTSWFESLWRRKGKKIKYLQFFAN